MPRRTRSVPRYCRHGRQAIVTIGGRTHYLGRYGSSASRAEYDSIVSSWLASGRSPHFGSEEPSVTVSGLIAAFLSHAKIYYGAKPRGQYANMRLVCKPLRKPYGKIHVDEFGPRQFKALRQSLIDADNCRTHINRTMKRVVQIFRWGVGEELVNESIPRTLAMVASLRRGKTTAREANPIQPADAAAVDATLPFMPPVVADMARFQRLTGCRPAEVCLLRPCDLDRSQAVWRYTPASHKTEHLEKSRAIFVGSQAQAILAAYLDRVETDCCFRPCDSEAARRAAATEARQTPTSCGNGVGTNRKSRPKRRPGDCYTSQSYARAIGRACEKAGTPHWTPNQLRHSAATEIRKRFGLEAAQVVLGHSQADVTQIYAQRDAELAARIMGEIG